MDGWMGSKRNESDPIGLHKQSKPSVFDILLWIMACTVYMFDALCMFIFLSEFVVWCCDVEYGLFQYYYWIEKYLYGKLLPRIHFSESHKKYIHNYKTTSHN